MRKRKQLIEEYIDLRDKRIYEEILNEYKNRYILNESRVDEDITPEEQQGIAVVYDYIRDFNFDKDYFNIFTTSLVIHQKLYSKCPFPEGFAGNLRDAQAILKNSPIEVVPADEARKYFNNYIATSNEIFLPLQEGDILKYIEGCIFTTTELIKVQPFMDGNKRTFRSLMNLLLKKITLPPVYIYEDIRREYKTALLKAMQTGEYEDLNNVYYLLISRSIHELALEKDPMEELTEEKKVKKLVEDIVKA